MNLESIKDVKAEHKELIKQFCGYHQTIRTQIDKGDVENANSNYLKLATTYTKIAEADLDPIHKRIAHEALTNTYQEVQGMNTPVLNDKSVRMMLSLTVILVVAIAAIMMRPSIVGLTTLGFGTDVAAEDTQDLNLTIWKQTTVNLDSMLGNPEGKLTYISTKGRKAQVDIIGKFMTITPDPGSTGKDRLTIYSAETQRPEKTRSRTLRLLITLPPVPQ